MHPTSDGEPGHPRFTADPMNCPTPFNVKRRVHLQTKSTARVQTERNLPLLKPDESSSPVDLDGRIPAKCAFWGPLKRESRKTEDSLTPATETTEYLRGRRRAARCICEAVVSLRFSRHSALVIDSDSPIPQASREIDLHPRSAVVRH